jgi:hypothetical protein
MNAGWTNPGLIAAFLSAIAAIAAAVATWRGPMSAARMAEQLRRSAENEMESRRFRFNVFATVMQGRAEIWSEDTVRALNSIDIAFHRSAKVREAWAELFQALNAKPNVSHVIDERIRKLLKEMASDLGLADALRLDDFGRVYFPTALGEEREVRALERQAALARLKGVASPTQNTADFDPTVELWPPKPD